MSCTVSQVVIGSVTLDLDPQKYDMPISRRGSVHRLIDGTTVWQDRGSHLTDMVLRLEGQLFALATVQALDTMYATTGASYTFTDFKGNQFTVIFSPGEESWSREPIYGSTIGWTYKMVLRVISVQKLLGVTQ